MSYPVRPFRRDPLATLEAMQDRLNRLLGDAFTGYRGRTPLWHPDIDVEERDDALLVEVRLPGVAPDEVAVDVSGRELTIRGLHEDASTGGETGEATEAAPRSAMARRYADFSYRLSLPPDVDAVDATMDHGLLTVRVPRSGAVKSRRVTIGRRAGEIEGESRPTGGEGGAGATPPTAEA